MQDESHATRGSDPNARLDEFERVLDLAASGDLAARDRLWSEFLPELRQLVVAWFEGQRAKFRWKKDPSIGPTHIVDMLWERLHARDRIYESGRRYLFKSFYTECVRIFLDHRKRSWRHHDGRVDLPTHFLAPDQSGEVFAKLDAALAKLRAVDKLDADIGAMRVMETVEDEPPLGGTRGLRNDEVAARLGVSKSTVEHRWKHVKAFLISELES